MTERTKLHYRITPSGRPVLLIRNRIVQMTEIHGDTQEAQKVLDAEEMKEYTDDPDFKRDIREFLRDRPPGNYTVPVAVIGPGEHYDLYVEVERFLV